MSPSTVGLAFFISLDQSERRRDRGTRRRSFSLVGDDHPHFTRQEEEEEERSKSSIKIERYRLLSALPFISDLSMDETSSTDLSSSAKGTFISRLNPESPPFEPASFSSAHHFQETDPMELPAHSQSPSETLLPEQEKDVHHSYSSTPPSPEVSSEHFIEPVDVPRPSFDREPDDILGNQSLLKQVRSFSRIHICSVQRMGFLDGSSGCGW